MSVNHWKFAPEVSGGPMGWSTDNFGSSRQALEAGRNQFDGPLYTAWVVEMTYAKQLPQATDLLANMKERAAEGGSDVNCFDALLPGDVEILDNMLRRTLSNWEDWLKGGKDGQAKASSVILIENLTRHEAAP
jgi:hypothetical protein